MPDKPSRTAPAGDATGARAAVARAGGVRTAQRDADLLALAERLLNACVDRGLTVATAESCTGGLVAHTITRIPGSSGYLAGGVVSYADRIKLDLLEVPGAELAAHGAVSAQVARSMAQGARKRLAVDLAVSVTGIAGPDGGGPAKPVGLTYIGVADGKGAEVRRFLWAGDRRANVEASVRAALELLLERVEAQPGPAR